MPTGKGTVNLGLNVLCVSAPLRHSHPMEAATLGDGACRTALWGALQGSIKELHSGQMSLTANSDPPPGLATLQISDS